MSFENNFYKQMRKLWEDYNNKLYESLVDTFAKEIYIDEFGVWDGTHITPQRYSNMFSQYVRYVRSPKQHEWDYFFMCEGIENKELQDQIIQYYNDTHKVGQKVYQPCNPNFNQESWRK